MRLWFSHCVSPGTAAVHVYMAREVDVKRNAELAKQLEQVQHWYAKQSFCMQVDKGTWRVLYLLQVCSQ